MSCRAFACHGDAWRGPGARDQIALQAKLDALIRTGNARNAFIGIDSMSLEEVEAFKRSRSKPIEGDDDDATAQNAGAARPAAASAR